MFILSECVYSGWKNKHYFRGKQLNFVRDVLYFICGKRLSDKLRLTQLEEVPLSTENKIENVRTVLQHGVFA
jgi:hypothetical protein